MFETPGLLSCYLPGCMLACIRKKDKQSRVLFMSHIAASIFDLFARVVV